MESTQLGVLLQASSTPALSGSSQGQGHPRPLQREAGVRGQAGLRELCPGGPQQLKGRARGAAPQPPGSTLISFP